MVKIVAQVVNMGYRKKTFIMANSKFLLQALTGSDLYVYSIYKL